MRDCAKCGACTVVCPVYQATGRESLSPRGRLHLLERLSTAGCSPTFAEILSKCLLCGACTAVCPRGLDPRARFLAARAALERSAGQHLLTRHLAEKALSHPGLMTGLIRTAGLVSGALTPFLPAASGLRLRLGLFAGTGPVAAPPPAPMPTAAGAEVAYFAGCLASHLRPEIARDTGRLLERTGRPALTPAGQACCGQAALAAGHLEEARRLARQNIAAFEATELPILASCASCFSHLASYPALLADDPDWQQRARRFADRLRELSHFLAADTALAAALKKNTAGRQLRVLYHDPCHLRFGFGITAPPRRLLAASPAVELVELPHGPQCCGMGGLFHLAHPDLSESIRSRLLNDAGPLGADTVVTTCSGCLLQWEMGLAASRRPTRVAHLACLLADTL